MGRMWDIRVSVIGDVLDLTSVYTPSPLCHYPSIIIGGITLGDYVKILFRIHFNIF